MATTRNCKPSCKPVLHFGCCLAKEKPFSLYRTKPRRSHLQAVAWTDKPMKRGRDVLAQADLCRWVIVLHTMISQDAKSTACQHASMHRLRLCSPPSSQVNRPWLASQSQSWPSLRLLEYNRMSLGVICINTLVITFFPQKEGSLLRFMARVVNVQYDHETSFLLYIAATVP